MWRSDAGSSWPEAAQAPVHPAPKGRRDGWGQEPSFRISRGTKKGQAKLVSRRTVIVTRDGMGMRDMNVESKDGSLFALGFSPRPETKYLRLNSYGSDCDVERDRCGESGGFVRPLWAGYGVFEGGTD